MGQRQSAIAGEYPTNRLAVSTFGLVMALNTLLFIALQAYIIRNLLKPELVNTQDRSLRNTFVGPLSYLLGAAAAWVSMPAAFAIYLLTPLWYIVPPQSRRAARTDAASDSPQAAPR